MATDRLRERAETLVTASSTMDDAEAREYLLTACAEDPALRDEVARAISFTDRTISIGSDAFVRHENARALVQSSHERPASVAHFVITGTLGVGGMGEVYSAHDERLDRKVALKAIRPERQLSRAARERFLCEARALSSLDHPNICRIYDYVEDGDDAYLALEFIDGVPLSSIGAGVRWPERLAIAEKIARALTVAHGSGLVHRDLKPDNVMLTRDGDVKVLDFGLARVSGEQSVDAPEGQTPGLHVAMTAAGAVVGTPLYMSPEQADGREVTAASDMYSFGLVLQELFTGESARERSDDVASQVESARAAHRRNPANLRGDLRRLIDRLTDKAPANRPTSTETAHRLSRLRTKPRRQALRFAATVIVAIAVASGVKYTLDVRLERSRAVDARQDAEALVAFMLTDLRAELREVGRLDALGGVAEQVLSYYGDIDPTGLSPEVTRQLAQGIQLVGEVQFERNELESAEEAFQQELALLTAHLDGSPDDGEAVMALGAAEFWLGQVDYRRREYESTEGHWRSYLDVAERLVALDSDRAAWQLELAYAHTNLVQIFLDLGRRNEALEALQSSLEVKRRLVSMAPDNREYIFSLVNGLNFLADAYASQRATDSEGAALAEGMELMASYVDANPKDAEALYRLSICQVKEGQRLRQLDRHADALPLLRAMVQTQRSLVQLDPTNARWKRELALGLTVTGQCLTALDDFSGAQTEFDSSLALYSDLIEQNPDAKEFALDLARLQQQIYDMQRQADRLDEALGTLDDMATRLNARRAATEDEALREDLDALMGWTQVNRARALEAAGDSEAARAEYTRCIERLQSLEILSDRRDILEFQAEALLALDRTDAAMEIVERLREIGPLTEELERDLRARGLVEVENEEQPSS